MIVMVWLMNFRCGMNSRLVRFVRVQVSVEKVLWFVILRLGVWCVLLILMVCKVRWVLNYVMGWMMIVMVLWIMRF